MFVFFSFFFFSFLFFSYVLFFSLSVSLSFGFDIVATL